MKVAPRYLRRDVVPEGHPAGMDPSVSTAIAASRGIALFEGHAATPEKVPPEPIAGHQRVDAALHLLPIFPQARRFTLRGSPELAGFFQTGRAPHDPGALGQRGNAPCFDSAPSMPSFSGVRMTVRAPKPRIRMHFSFGVSLRAQRAWTL